MRPNPPDQSEAVKAIGNTESVPGILKRALDPGRDFDPIPEPKPGDWLAEHPEEGQTFDDFSRIIPAGSAGIKGRIYLQPLGKFDEDRSPSLAVLREYAEAYFRTGVSLLPPKDIFGAPVRTRINPFIDKLQVLTGDVLKMLKKGIPDDAYCLLGMTMEDLYPDPFWNFVFGQISLRHRIGIFSFARYDPLFYGEKRGRGYARLLLRRSCKVLAHETAHMFFLKHCIFFRCVMNGSNHLDESDARPLSLCPVCLRKLQHVIGFDVRERYGALLEFYSRFELNPEKKWVEKRLKRIGHD